MGHRKYSNFFIIDIGVSEDYEARLIELNNRTFMRKELVECIENYMEPFPSSHRSRKVFN